MTNSPSLVRCVGNETASLATESASSNPLAVIFHRNTALLDTLLTFCPPGPELRTKLNSICDNGIFRSDVISNNGGKVCKKTDATVRACPVMGGWVGEGYNKVFAKKSYTLSDAAAVTA